MFKTLFELFFIFIWFTTNWIATLIGGGALLQNTFNVTPWMSYLLFGLSDLAIMLIIIYFIFSDENITENYDNDENEEDFSIEDDDDEE